jgi:hypothetical protein
VGLDEIDDCCLETQLGHRARKHDPVEQFMLSCVLELFACEIVPTGAATRLSQRLHSQPSASGTAGGLEGTCWDEAMVCRRLLPATTALRERLLQGLEPTTRRHHQPSHMAAAAEAPAVKAATTSPWQPPSLCGRAPTSVVWRIASLGCGGILKHRRRAPS